MGKTVLLGEDNADNRQIYRLILEHGGYRVIEAFDGEQGVRMAREERPDLILMDISIPRIDGWEVAEILRGEEETARTPILVCTAHDSAADRARAAQLGCEAYLAKPCPPRVLLAEVERWLSASAVAPAPPQPEAIGERPAPRWPRAAHVGAQSRSGPPASPRVAG